MFESFYQEYSPQEREIVVQLFPWLSVSLDDHPDYCQMAIMSLGVMYCDTGEVDFREMWLKWPIARKKLGTSKEFDRLGTTRLYRVKARKMRDDLVSPEELYSWALIDVLESDVSCPPLEACWEGYWTFEPDKEDLLGVLQIDRRFCRLEGSVPWNGTRVPIFIKVDLEDRSHWNIVCNIAADLAADSAQMDQAMRKFVAKQLAEFVNQRNNTAHLITEEEFVKCLTIEEIQVTNDGHFAVYYDNDGLLPKNIIKVSGFLQEIMMAKLTDRTDLAFR
mgnify:FL=1